MENLLKCISGINWPLLKAQRFQLTTINDDDMSIDQRDALNGIQNLLDSFCDAVVEDGIVSEETVFKGCATGEQQFIHSDLGSDWNTQEFPLDGSYIGNIEMTSNSPENFELSIWEDGNGVRYEYQYDNKVDAEADWLLFQVKIGLVPVQ